MEDATSTLLRQLDNPTQYVKKDRVAVFMPHTRTVQLPDGTTRTIKVTERDLETIANNVNASYQRDGVLVKLVIGHRKSDPAANEKTQPEVAGYAKDYRATWVSRPGGKALRLTHTEYVRADRTDVLNGNYPERSAEYDPESKTIRAVALLTRDQWLNLGTVSYSAGKTLTYMGGPMPDMDDAPFTPDEEKQYARCAKYMRMKYSKLAAYMDDDMGGLAGMGASNATMPGSDPAAPYQSSSGTVDYAAVNARLQTLEAEREAARKALVASEARRLLDPCRNAIKFNYERELSTLVSLPSDQHRAQHVEYMLDTYQRIPSGSSFIPVYQGDTSPSVTSDPTKPPPKHDEIMSVIYEETRQGRSITYDAAKARVFNQK